MQLERFLNRIDNLSLSVGKLAAFIVIPNVFALVYEVIARYVFKAPTIWSFEITYFLYSAHFMLGAAYALKDRSHIRVEVIYSRLSKRTRAIIDSAGYLLFFFPATIALLIGGFDLVRESIAMGERSGVSSWRPVMWPFRAILPLGIFFLLLQGVAEFIRAVPKALGRVK